MYEAGVQSSTNGRHQQVQQKQQKQPGVQPLPTTQTLSDLKKQRSKLLQQQLMERAAIGRTHSGTGTADKPAVIASSHVRVSVNGSVGEDQKPSDDPQQYYIHNFGNGDSSGKPPSTASLTTAAEIYGDKPSTKNGVGGTGNAGSGAGRTRNQEDSCCIIS